MKYILSFFGLLAVVCAICFCRGGNIASQEDFMRIHVTANSSSIQDKDIKYIVKDAVVEFLIPELAFAETKLQAGEIIAKNLVKINEVVKETLKRCNVSYGCSVSIKQEEVPARVYDNIVLEEGVYDCLKIDLGEAKGDNWWCVVFPAVCFIDSKNSENLEYISKIWEIINSVT